MLQSLIFGGTICLRGNICNATNGSIVQGHTLLSMLLPRQLCLWVKLLGRCRHHCLGDLHRTSRPSLYCCHPLTGSPGLQAACSMLRCLVHRSNLHNVHRKAWPRHSSLAGRLGNMRQQSMVCDVSRSMSTMKHSAASHKAVRPKCNLRSFQAV